MSDEARGRILTFLDARQKQLIEESRIPKVPGAGPLSFAVHSLAREDNILMTRPLFELLLMHLWKGDGDAKEIAQMLQQTTNIEVPPWPL